jgi:hypothetical protein
MHRCHRTITGVALLAAAATSGSAAEQGQLPPQTPSHQTVPEAGAANPSGGSSEPLGDKLDRQRGVLRPPAGIDPNMTQAPPAEGRTSVIRPPGTPGGAEAPNPK